LETAKKAIGFYRKNFQEPSYDEGFDAIEVIP
jgi:hypothetical protein